MSSRVFASAISVTLFNLFVGLQAVNIHEEDEHLCRLISRIGAQIMPKSGDVLTHCNTVSDPQQALLCTFPHFCTSKA
jgi:methylthioribose-1-phosphate isomerase